MSYYIKHGLDIWTQFIGLDQKSAGEEAFRPRNVRRHNADTTQR